MATTQGATTLREEWYEMPSYAYPAEPGFEITECLDCGWWSHIALELDPDAPHGLAIREWHQTSCPVWNDQDQEQ